MSASTPPLEKGDMSAAERANLRQAEQIMVLLVQSLRKNANLYPKKLQTALSDPRADTRVEITIGGETVYGANLRADGSIKNTQVDAITEPEAHYFKNALAKQKGEQVDIPQFRNMRVLVNGEVLFEMRDGKVLQNDLPLEFTRAIVPKIQSQPVDLSVSSKLPEHPSSLTQQLESPNSSSPSPPSLDLQSSREEFSSVPTEDEPSPQRSTQSISSGETATANPQQESLNRELMVQAGKALDILRPGQPQGNRSWVHPKYSIAENEGVRTVYIAETGSTIRQEGETITGIAREKDVEAMKSLSHAYAQQAQRSASPESEVEW